MVFCIPMTRGFEKLLKHLSLGGNLLWLMDLYSSIKDVISLSSRFNLFDKISFKNLAYNDL